MVSADLSIIGWVLLDRKKNRWWCPLKYQKQVDGEHNLLPVMPAMLPTTVCDQFTLTSLQMHSDTRLNVDSSYFSKCFCTIHYFHFWSAPNEYSDMTVAWQNVMGVCGISYLDLTVIWGFAFKSLGCLGLSCRIQCEFPVWMSYAWALMQPSGANNTEFFIFPIGIQNATFSPDQD